ncbi:Dynein heavy chain [Glycine soja]
MRTTSWVVNTQSQILRPLSFEDSKSRGGRRQIKTSKEGQLSYPNFVRGPSVVRMRPSLDHFEKAVASGGSNLARLGELGGKHLLPFPINRGRREEQKCSTLLIFNRSSLFVVLRPSTGPLGPSRRFLQKAVASGGSNPARLGELGGNHLPYFAINRGGSEEEKAEALPKRFRNVFREEFRKDFNRSSTFFIRSSSFFDLQRVSDLLDYSEPSSRAFLFGNLLLLRFYQVKVKSLDTTSIKELGRLMEPLQMQTFRKTYRKILELTIAEVSIEAIVSLTQYYDQPLRKPYLSSGCLPSLSRIATVVKDSARGLDRIKQIRNGIAGLPQKYLEDKARGMAHQGDWIPFMDVLALLIFGVVLFPNVDVACSRSKRSLSQRLCETETNMLAIIAKYQEELGLAAAHEHRIADEYAQVYAEKEARGREIQEKMKADMEAIKEKMTTMMEAMMSVKKIMEANAVAIAATSVVAKVNLMSPSGIKQMNHPTSDMVGKDLGSTGGPHDVQIQNEHAFPSYGLPLNYTPPNVAYTPNKNVNNSTPIPIESQQPQTDHAHTHEIPHHNLDDFEPWLGYTTEGQAVGGIPLQKPLEGPQMQLQKVCKKGARIFQRIRPKMERLGNSSSTPKNRERDYHNDSRHVTDLVFASERIKVGPKRGKFDHPTRTTEKTGANEEGEKEGETHAVTAIPIRPSFPPTQQCHYSANNKPPPYPPPMRKPVEFTPIPVSYADLLPYLLDNSMVAITLAKVHQPPFLREYDSNATCACHGEAPGHSIEHGRALKRKVQGLIDAGWLKFEENCVVTLEDYSSYTVLQFFSNIARQTITYPPSLIQLIQNNLFHGLPNEDPYAHLATYIEICNTIRLAGVPEDAIRLSLFSFSLSGEAKRWLHYFKGNSLKTWDEVFEKFLKKGLLRKTPTHGFSEPIQLNIFIDGLRPQSKRFCWGKNKVAGCAIYGGAHNYGCCVPNEEPTHEVNYMGNQPRQNFNNPKEECKAIMTRSRMAIQADEGRPEEKVSDLLDYTEPLSRVFLFHNILLLVVPTAAICSSKGMIPLETIKRDMTTLGNITKSPFSSLPFKIKGLDITNIKELGRLMGPLQMQAFRKAYKKILDLTIAEISTEAVVSLTQYYDQPLRCFTFGDFQLGFGERIGSCKTNLKRRSVPTTEVLRRQGKGYGKSRGVGPVYGRISIANLWGCPLSKHRWFEELAACSRSKRNLSQHLCETETNMLAIVSKYQEELNLATAHEHKVADEYAQVYAEKEARGKVIDAARVMGEVEEVQEQMKADMEAMKEQMATMMEAMISIKKIMEANAIAVIVALLLRWRDLAAQVAPPMTKMEMITMIVDTLPVFYYEKWWATHLQAPSSFAYLVFTDERIKVGLKRDKFDHPALMNEKTGANKEDKKEGETHAAIAVPTWPMKRPVEFIPILVSYANLLPYLLNNSMVAITPTKVPQPPFLRGYDSNAMCAYHGGAPGHSSEHCMTSKRKVQCGLKFEENRGGPLGTSTLTFRGLHALTFRGLHVLTFRGLHAFTFRGLHVLAFRGLHAFTFRGLHLLAIRGLHILAFRGLHFLPFRGLLALALVGLHALTFRGLHVLTFRGLHAFAFRGLHVLTFRGPNILIFKGLHVLIFRGLHTLTFKGLHVLAFRGLHVLAFRGLHVLAFRRLHILAFRGLHVLHFRGLHVLAFRGLHILAFRGLHILAFRGLHVLAFKGLHTLGFKGLHICTLREFKFPFISSWATPDIGGCQLCEYNQRGRLSRSYYAYRGKISPVPLQRDKCGSCAPTRQLLHRYISHCYLATFCPATVMPISPCGSISWGRAHKTQSGPGEVQQGPGVSSSGYGPLSVLQGIVPAGHPVDPKKSNRVLGFPALIMGLCQFYRVSVTPSKVIRPPTNRAFIKKYCAPRQAEGETPQQPGDGQQQATNASPPPPEPLNSSTKRLEYCL